jgi:hypothetical protein
LNLLELILGSSQSLINDLGDDPNIGGKFWVILSIWLDDKTLLFIHLKQWEDQWVNPIDFSQRLVHVEDDGKKILGNFFKLWTCHGPLLLQIFVRNLVVFNHGIDLDHRDITFWNQFQVIDNISLLIVYQRT